MYFEALLCKMWSFFFYQNQKNYIEIGTIFET